MGGTLILDDHLQVETSGKVYDQILHNKDLNPTRRTALLKEPLNDLFAGDNVTFMTLADQLPPYLKGGTYGKSCPLVHELIQLIYQRSHEPQHLNSISFSMAEFGKDGEIRDLLSLGGQGSLQFVEHAGLFLTGVSYVDCHFAHTANQMIDTGFNLSRDCNQILLTLILKVVNRKTGQVERVSRLQFLRFDEDFLGRKGFDEVVRISERLLADHSPNAHQQVRSAEHSPLNRLLVSNFFESSCYLWACSSMSPDIQPYMHHLVNFASWMKKSRLDRSTHGFSHQVYQLSCSGHTQTGHACANTRMSMSTRSSLGSSTCGDVPKSMAERRGSIFTPNAELSSVFTPQGEDPEADFYETFLEARHDVKVIKDIETEVERLRLSASEKMDSKCVKSIKNLGQGLSIYDIRTAFLRIIMGAGYRVYKKGTALTNTGQPYMDLPYSWKNLVHLIEGGINLYKRLDYVKDEQHLDELLHCVHLMDSKVRSTTYVRNDAGEVQEEGNEEVFKLNDLLPRDLVFNAWECGLIDGVSGSAAEEAEPPSSDSECDEHWEPLVNGETTCEVVYDESEGVTLMSRTSASFWHQEFLPKALMAFSVITQEDCQYLSSPEFEEYLEKWFQDSQNLMFLKGLDLTWPSLSFEDKRTVHLGHKIIEPYLYGFLADRERENTRKTGTLSSYLPFMDRFFRTRNMEESKMRVGFPYYLGSATWPFLHHIPERFDELGPQNWAQNLKAFVDFLVPGFARGYACPFCMYHFNVWVNNILEVDQYPVEYMINNLDNKTSTVDRIKAAKGPDDLRFILWALHNAVNSTITRVEPWFLGADDPDSFVHTPRFWPSSHCYTRHKHNMGEQSLCTDLIHKLNNIMLPSIALARYRQDVIKNSRSASPTETKKLANLLNQAKQALNDSRVLQETYRYNPDKINNIPVLMGRLDEETKLKILYDPSFDASLCEQFLIQKNLH